MVRWQPAAAVILAVIAAALIAAAVSLLAVACWGPTDTCQRVQYDAPQERR